jgi:hypothetical protein
VDKAGKIRLSRRELLQEAEKAAASAGGAGAEDRGQPQEGKRPSGR